jgi:hypothetical protein
MPGDGCNNAAKEWQKYGKNTSKILPFKELKDRLRVIYNIRFFVIQIGQNVYPTFLKSRIFQKYNVYPGVFPSVFPGTHIDAPQNLCLSGIREFFIS